MITSVYIAPFQLRALFNNVSTSKKSELHGPTCFNNFEGVKMKP